MGIPGLAFARLVSRRELSTIRFEQRSLGVRHATVKRRIGGQMCLRGRCGDEIFEDTILNDGQLNVKRADLVWKLADGRLVQLESTTARSPRLTKSIEFAAGAGQRLVRYPGFFAGSPPFGRRGSQLRTEPLVSFFCGCRVGSNRR